MKIFSKALLACMAAAFALLPTMQVKAQSAAEPAVVISMASIDSQMDDIGYLAEAAGFGQMSFLIKMQMEQFLAGLDTEKPGGALLFIEEGQMEPKVLGFMPLDNMDDFLNTISPYVEIEEGDDYITIIPDGGSELLVKEVDGFGFISDREEMFESIPSNPSSLLGDLPEKFNIGARVYAQRIPQSMRDMWLDMIEEGYADSMAEMGAFPTDLQEKNFQMQMESFRSLFNETEELVMGFSADEDSESLHFDFSIVGMPGSVLAEQAAAAQKFKESRFGGFLMEGAAFTANMCSEISETDAENYEQMIGQVREEILNEINDSDIPDAQYDKVEGIVDDLIGVLTDTVKAGRIDMGAVITTEETVEFAVGLQVANSAKLEGAVKKLVEMAEEEPAVGEFVEFKLDIGTMEGLRMHKVIIQVPENEEEMVDLLGEQMTLLLGFGDDFVYLAGSGKDPKELLFKAMKGKPVAEENLMMQYNVYIAPILKMASEIEGEEMMEEMAEKLAANGRDRIRLSVETIENGFKGTFDIQDGILEMIGVAANNMGALMGGGSDF